MVFWHGTTYESGMNIKRSHLFLNTDRIWEDSRPGLTYFFKDEIDGESMAGLNCALENAQISMAVKNELSTKVAVVKLTVPDDIEFDDDISSNNMHDIAIQVDSKELNRMIEDGSAKIEVIFFDDVYAPGIRFCYLALAGDNTKADLTPFEYEILRGIKRSNISFYEECIADPVWSARESVA